MDLRARPLLDVDYVNRLPKADGSGRHGLIEDGLAILTGSLLLGLGLNMYSCCTLFVGGIGGLALLVEYAGVVGFWFSFPLLNLPFYWLAVERMGWSFTLRTIVSVLLVAIWSRLGTEWVVFASLAPIYCAVVGALLMGTGLLILFRHGAALGGTNILALHLQELIGISAGAFLLVTDLLILAAAALVLPPGKLVLSIVGAVIVNAILAINHRTNRYVGLS